jgi:hypothetical protein
MVILAVDSTARPFECDIGEKPNILAGYREFNPRARQTSVMQQASDVKQIVVCLSGRRQARDVRLHSLTQRPCARGPVAYTF